MMYDPDFDAAIQEQCNKFMERRQQQLRDEKIKKFVAKSVAWATLVAFVAVPTMYVVNRTRKATQESES